MTVAEPTKRMRTPPLFGIPVLPQHRRNLLAYLDLSINKYRR